MLSKKQVASIITLLILLIGLVIFLRLISFNKNILSKQKNYIITYDGITDSDIRSMAAYDMAILEPLNVTTKQIASLKKENTITYGYQSIFEVERYNHEKISLLEDEDYLYIDEVKQFNQYYQCYYGDIRSPHYREVLLDSIEKNVIEKGFNGVFFDTLDDIEYFIEKPVKTELFMGYIEFFKLLNTKYPNLSIIQNRAFKLYTLGSAAYVDGLMYEDLKYQVLESSQTYEYYNNLIQKLSKTAEENNGVILALSYEELEKNHELAKKLGWLWGTQGP